MRREYITFRGPWEGKVGKKAQGENVKLEEGRGRVFLPSGTRSPLGGEKDRQTY